MKRLNVSTLTLITLASTTQVAQGASFEGTSSAIFGIPTPDSGVVFDGVGTNEFETGNPAFGSSPNIFIVNGLDFSTTDNTQFAVANLVYTNGQTLVNTTIDTVPVNFALDFSNPGDISESFTFTFDLEVTPNNTGTQEGDADSLTILDVTSETNFVVEDDLFTLQLLGFSNDGGVTIENEFTLYEDETTTSQLFATIISVPEDVDVPEPSLTGFLALGISAFVIKNHRQKKD